MNANWREQTMYRTILVPVDLDQPAPCREAIATACSIAGCFGAKIILCTVVSSAEAIMKGDWFPISVEELLFDARARLDGLAADVDEKFHCGVEVASGTVARAILEIAERRSVDLILLVPHPPRARDYLLAAKAIRVARRAPCSVLIARHASA
jgi:nucleotide-binding universal stress UspA family protein